MVKYTREVLEKAARHSKSIAGVLRALGIQKWAGGTHQHVKRRLEHFEIDTSHFTGMSYDRDEFPPPNKLEPKEILVLRKEGYRQKRYLLERALLEVGMPYECASCGQGPEWQGRVLTLPVDHIDGDFLNDREENLRFLCPNCHAQTPTFSSRNRAGVA